MTGKVISIVYDSMSRVVVVRRELPLKAKTLGMADYFTMLEVGLKELAGSVQISDAIKRYIPPGIVGLKVNCLTRKYNSTSVAVVKALIALLARDGRDENEIIVWDRTSNELEGAGFKLNLSSSGVRVFGTDVSRYGYSPEIYSSGEVNSLVSRILTEEIQSLINLPVLKDHSIAGMSGGLKNLFGVINNPNKYHDNNCDPFAAEILGLAPVKEKQKLTIIDAARVQFNGGPGFDSRFLAEYGGIILSDDPVAADSVALMILEQLRTRNHLPTLEKSGRAVKYLATAEKLGLGMADITKIDLVIREFMVDGSIRQGELF
ncbi:MAG: DUF362 domain-containing protein [Candidatus Zixiibacteriota bacterium]